MSESRVLDNEERVKTRPSESPIEERELAENTQEEEQTIVYSEEKPRNKSEQYKEEMARNRFRLIFPGETLIQVN